MANVPAGKEKHFPGRLRKNSQTAGALDEGVVQLTLTISETYRNQFLIWLYAVLVCGRLL